MSHTKGFYTDNRWNNLYTYADTLKDLIRAGGDPVEESIITLSLILEQFPESPPLDLESHHVNCVNHLCKTVLGGLRQFKLDQAEAEGPDGA